MLNTRDCQRTGLQAVPLARWVLGNPRTEHWMRGVYAMRSLWQVKNALLDTTGRQDYWQVCMHKS